jgi:hypothetical protein
MSPPDQTTDAQGRGDFRQYAPEQLGSDGYPAEWHGGSIADPSREGIKHLVRARAGHRCVRCQHPYRNGAHGRGEWSPCDERCEHGIENTRWRARGESEWSEDRAAMFEAILGPGIDLEFEARWRILTVHHLDGDKANCRWWNLAALCQRCHLQIQGKVQMARVWPWEHSEWFKPYVAGYYASVYLGEELSRQEVDSRLDELLALEKQVATP